MVRKVTLLFALVLLICTMPALANTSSGPSEGNDIANVPGSLLGSIHETIIRASVNMVEAKAEAVIEEIKSKTDDVSNLFLSNEKEGDEFPFDEEDKDVYNYCPSVIKKDDTYYIFYTKLHESDQGWQDYIYLRTAKLINRDGDEEWEYSDEKQVLRPTEGEFDSHHVCDPSVIQGNFQYNDIKYKYMMAYLATTHANAPECKNNDIGIALSNNLIDWVKCGRRVSHQTVSNQWGVGQPSLIRDKDGECIVIYTGDGIQARRIYSDTGEGSIINVSTDGTRNMHNADFAIMGEYLYVIYDSNWSEPQVSNISNSVIVYKAKWDGTFEGLQDLLWEAVDEVGEEETGFPWNHNACLTRDFEGYLAERSAFVSKCTKYGQGHEYTYRIFRFLFSENGK